MTAPLNDDIAPRSGGPVIDLREDSTRVSISREDNPFATLPKQERMRLIVQVLCELVAYGELQEDSFDQPGVLGG